MYVYTFEKDPRVRKTVAGNLEFNRVTAAENIVPLSDERAMETTSVRLGEGRGSAQQLSTFVRNVSRAKLL